MGQRKQQQQSQTPSTNPSSAELLGGDAQPLESKGDTKIVLGAGKPQCAGITLIRSYCASSLQQQQMGNSLLKQK